MKRSLHLILLILTFTARSQTSVYHPFPGVNSYWDYSCSFYCGSGFPSWVGYGYSISVSNDTIIGSQAYHKLYIPYLKIDSSGCTSASVSGGIYKGCLREDLGAKKVYYIRPSLTAEQLLYDFNLAVGDTVKGFIQAPGMPDTVISIDSVQLSNGNYVKRWFINSCYNIYLIEGVGSTYGLIEQSPGCGPDWADRSLSCMSALSYLYPNITDCDMINSAPDLADENSIRIYPNPSSAWFHVEHAGNKKLQTEVRNVHGELILSTDKKEIDLSKNAKGLYFLKINDGKNIISKKIILE